MNLSKTFPIESRIFKCVERLDFRISENKLPFRSRPFLLSSSNVERFHKAKFVEFGLGSNWRLLQPSQIILESSKCEFIISYLVNVVRSKTGFSDKKNQDGHASGSMNFLYVPELDGYSKIIISRFCRETIKNVKFSSGIVDYKGLSYFTNPVVSPYSSRLKCYGFDLNVMRRMSSIELNFEFDKLQDILRELVFSSDRTGTLKFTDSYDDLLTKYVNRLAVLFSQITRSNIQEFHNYIKEYHKFKKTFNEDNPSLEQRLVLLTDNELEIIDSVLCNQCYNQYAKLGNLIINNFEMRFVKNLVALSSNC